MAHGISNDDPTKKEIFDSPEEFEKKIDQLADWIRNAKHVIVFTGLSIIAQKQKHVSRVLCHFSYFCLFRCWHFNINRVINYF